MNVLVTEFVRPDGRQVKRVVRGLSEELACKAAAAITKAGLRITLEHLGNGVSSVAVEKIGVGNVMTQLVATSIWWAAVNIILRKYTPEVLAEWEKKREELK